MITVGCVFYTQMLPGIPPWSRCYTPAWVDRLYRGIARHAPEPFRFVCLVDQPYPFTEAAIEQQPLRPTSWALACQQLYGIEADRLLLTGLDTLILGPLDDLFAYRGDLAVPRDPYRQQYACNGVVLCPTRRDLAEAEAPDDMRVLDGVPHDWLDDLFPGQVVSYKAQVREHGAGAARICYFHGEPKFPTLDHDDPLRVMWESL